MTVKLSLRIIFKSWHAFSLIFPYFTFNPLWQWNLFNLSKVFKDILLLNILSPWSAAHNQDFISA